MGLTALAVAVAIFAVALIAHANPTFWASSASTATATTSVAYITKGAATTTTPVYDSYSVNGTNQTNTNNNQSAESAVMLLRLTASSSATTLNISFEYSQDKVDWYQDNLQVQQNGTTSQQIAIQTANTYSWVFASSTIGGDANIGSTTMTKAITVPTPTRYVRPVFTMTGANGAIWAVILPKKQDK